jgi:hypothetical protein
MGLLNIYHINIIHYFYFLQPQPLIAQISLTHRNKMSFVHFKRSFDISLFHLLLNFNFICNNQCHLEKNKRKILPILIFFLKELFTFKKLFFL